MEEKQDVLSELHLLIEMQMQTLAGKLTEAEAKKYRFRQRRIAELLESIDRHGVKNDSA